MAAAELRIWNSLPEDEDDLIGRLQGAAAVLNMRAYTRFTARVLRSAPDLQMISVSGTGTDHIDLEAAAAAGIIVCNTPSANTISVAEHTWALLLGLARGLRWMEDRMRAGEWRHHFGVELYGKQLGLVGLGRIGSHVARIARGFGMVVKAWSFTADADRAAACGAELQELDPLLSSSDIVSLHLRLSDASRLLLDDRRIRLLKPSALLVNTARGALVDEAALAAALHEGRLAGAALDCYSEEPLPADHPLRSTPHTLLIPHAGWMTVEARERMLGEPVDNILAWRAGSPRNCVQQAAAAAVHRQNQISTPAGM